MHKAEEDHGELRPEAHQPGRLWAENPCFSPSLANPPIPSQSDYLSDDSFYSSSHHSPPSAIRLREARKQRKLDLHHERALRRDEMEHERALAEAAIKEKEREEWAKEEAKEHEFEREKMRLRLGITRASVARGAKGELEDVNGIDA